MEKSFILIIVILLFSCNKNKKNEGIIEPLLSSVVEYQKKYPIPIDAIKNHKNDIFIYYLWFEKETNDTIIKIQRSSGGLSKSVKGYGVYQSERLKPTFIIDEMKLGIKYYNFIPISNNSFYFSKKISYSESSPPIYKYLLKKGKIKLMKIDTIWNKWD